MFNPRPKKSISHPQSSARVGGFGFGKFVNLCVKFTAKALFWAFLVWNFVNFLRKIHKNSRRVIKSVNFYLNLVKNL